MKNKLYILLPLLICLSACNNATISSSSNKSSSSGGSTSTSEPIDVYYDVYFNTRGGSLVDKQRVKANTKVTIPSVPNLENNSFLGWTLDDLEFPIDLSTYLITQETYFYAKWEKKTYPLSLRVNGTSDCKILTTAGEYLLYDSDVLLSASTPKTCSFDGWYINNEKKSSLNTYSFNMPGYGVEVEARWNSDVYYSLTIDNTEESYGNVTGEGSYKGGNNVTVTATPNPNYYFAGWFNGDNCVSINKTYSFTMPHNDYELKAYWHFGGLNFDESTNTIKCGHYPQSIVSNNSLITELNNLTEKNSRGYYEYNNEEYYKYTTKLTKTYTDGVTREAGTYYFKVEDVLWDVYGYNPTRHTYQASAHNILIAEPFELVFSQTNLQKGSWFFFYKDAASTYYLNEYAHGHMREYVNNMYHTIFNNGGGDHTLKVDVDNSVNSMEYKDSYATSSESTNDYVYVLSYEEYNRLSMNQKMATVTDYAIATGVSYLTDGYNGYYWMRSAYTNSGEILMGKPNGSYGYTFACDTYSLHCGVRPALELTYYK